MRRPLTRVIAFAALCVTGITSAAAQSGDKLTIERAIDKALHNNAEVLLANARRDEAAGKQTRARAELLPQLSADVSQSRQQTNLAAQGITFPGLPPTTTYNRFQARLKLRQSLIDVGAWNSFQSAKNARKAAAAREQVAREQIATRTAIRYVRALRAKQSVDAANADRELARSLEQLANDQHEAGLASGVDVARAQTRVSRQQARLAQKRTEAAQARLRLARVTGLPQDQSITLVGDLTAAAAQQPPAAEEVIQAAIEQRPELRLARQRANAKEQGLAAARAERLPSLELVGAYGDSGNTPDENVEQSYRIGAQVSVPIFSGGAIAGHVDTAASRLDQAQIRARDTRDQIEQDVRLALRTLNNSRKQVRAARDNRDLARRELELSRDRFAAGVTDNVEVINAQTELANARDRLVAARARHATARVNLAAARGVAEAIDFAGTQHDQ